MKHIGWIAGVVLLFVPTGASAQSIAEDVTVTMDPVTSAVALGDHLDITLEVTNHSDSALHDLVLHVDITDPDRSSSVDPEDWTATLSKDLGQLGPGQSTTTSWRLQPISAGTFTVYAVALAAGAETVAASNVLEVSVEDRRSLNPNGILPVALGAPVVIGGLLAAQLRLGRRTPRGSTSEVTRAAAQPTHTGTA